MNSAMNKTFYTCSTEWLFLQYKKISKKAVYLGQDLMAISEQLIYEFCETIS